MKRRIVSDVDFEAVKENRGYNTNPTRGGVNAGHYALGQHCDSSAEASS